MSIIKVVAKETIKPSAPTPNHLRNHKVSLLDQFAPSSYIPFIFFYPNKLPNNNNNLDASRIFLSQLKESLSEILTIYHPLAGRLKLDTAFVDCNDEGVDFIEAQSNGSLFDFLKQPDIASLNNFLPCNGNAAEKGPTIAPVAVKATVFETCGGVVLGVCIFHKVVDAVAAVEFLRSWTKICRGFKEKVEHPDFKFASSLFPPKESLPSDFVREFDNFLFKRSSKLFMRRYVFNAASIATIRTKFASENVANQSRVEALTAFVVEHMSKAKDDALGISSMITHAVNLRRRMDPPLSHYTFGSIVWIAFLFYEENNGDLVEILREAFDCLNKDSISELQKDDELITAMSESLESVKANEKMKIYRFTSWLNMGFYDVDFGWGKPAWVAHMGDMVNLRSKQQVLFMESGNGKDVELWIAVDEAELSALEKDQEFLAYATPNPSILFD